MWFCGLSSVTSASRTFFAFSRDGGLPFSPVIRRVSQRFRTPHVAIGIATVLPLLLVVVTRLFSGEAFDAATSLATTALYVSYGAPIALGALARSRGRWKKRGPFHLGAFGMPIAGLAVLWCLFVIVVFAIPPNQAYGITLGVVAGSLTLLYLVFARGRFKGPKVHVEELEKA
jgi:amino acid transporter